jgi:O-antigen chain-terminating methyltransferase
MPDFELQPHFELKPEGYRIKDFVHLLQANFLRAAYAALLGRDPDPEGLRHFLERLECGQSKVLVLGLIRYSAEGRGRGVPVRGLAPRFAVERACQIPIVGYILQLAIALVRLPRIVQDARRDENHTASRLAALSDHTSAADRALHGAIAHWTSSQREIIGRIEGILAKHRQTHRALGESMTANQSAQATFNAAMQDTVARTTTALETAIGKLTSEVTEIEQEFARKRDMEQANARASDGIYAAFENKFRGKRQDIKHRVSIYLPKLLEAGIGAADKPVIDVGCGRGEWLELLKEHGLHGRGVDLNKISLAYCADIGLDVIECDAVEYLRRLPADSVGAVTGFHIVEHLPFFDLVSLLQETTRVLHAGGIAIFETPNPENVLVGSNTFYLDPTHRNPSPPATLEFIVEATGLRDVTIVSLHPYPEWNKVKSDDPVLEEFVNTRFFGPQDYAVIGRKP